MATVGIRELKAHLSAYLKRIRRGERVVVTARGRPIAMLVPAPETPEDERLEALLREGIASWEGGKPRGAARPPRITGPTVADAVIEDRR